MFLLVIKSYWLNKLGLTLSICTYVLITFTLILIYINILFLNFILDENDAFYKKPLFSDDENDDDDDAMSDNEKTEQWRKDRFKRESFLAQVYIYIYCSIVILICI